MRNLLTDYVSSMRDTRSEVVEYFGNVGDAKSGAFNIPADGNSNYLMRAIAAVGDGWEHVSVSLPHRCPTWPEMCRVKDLFWLPEEEVVQFHPRRSEYVNIHPYCLHLWRPVGGGFMRPDPIFVGKLK